MVPVIPDSILDLMHCWTRLLSLHPEPLPFTTQTEIADSIPEDTSPCSPGGQDAACLEDHVQVPTIPDHPHVDYLEDQHPVEVAVALDPCRDRCPDQCLDQVSVHLPV